MLHKIINLFKKEEIKHIDAAKNLSPNKYELLVPLNKLFTLQQLDNKMGMFFIPDTEFEDEKYVVIQILNGKFQPDLCQSTPEELEKLITSANESPPIVYTELSTMLSKPIVIKSGLQNTKLKENVILSYYVNAESKKIIKYIELTPKITSKELNEVGIKTSQIESLTPGLYMFNDDDTMVYMFSEDYYIGMFNGKYGKVTEFDYEFIESIEYIQTNYQMVWSNIKIDEKYYKDDYEGEDEIEFLILEVEG